MDDLFSPPGVDWRRVSPRLAVVRRSVLALVAVVPLALVAALVTFGPLTPLGAAVGAGMVLAVTAWAWWLVGRSVRRVGYAETADELVVTKGALFRRLVVVPYGRLQYVDVTAGPLDQLAGIASVQVHTASPLTSAVIPGVPAEEAARLRDRLTVSADPQTAGL